MNEKVENGFSVQDTRNDLGNGLLLRFLKITRNPYNIYRTPFDRLSRNKKDESVAAIAYHNRLLVIFRVHPDNVTSQNNNPVKLQQIAKGLSNDLISYISTVGISHRSLPLDVISYLDNFFKTLRYYATQQKSKTPLSVMDSSTLGLSLCAAEMNPNCDSITAISLGQSSFAWVEKGNRMKVKKTPLPQLSNMMLPYYPTIRDLTYTSLFGEFKRYGIRGQFPVEYLKYYPLILTSHQIYKMPSDFPTLQFEAFKKHPDLILGNQPHMVAAVIGGRKQT